MNQKIISKLGLIQIGLVIRWKGRTFIDNFLNI